MSTELTNGGVKFGDGTIQNTAAVTLTSVPGWNVTYTSGTGGRDQQISSGGSWNVPANCLGVYVVAEVWGGNNNGGTGRAQIKNSGGGVIGTVFVNGTNVGSAWSRGDGGSGMADGGGAFIPLPSNAASIYFDIYDNGVSGRFFIQAYVTR